MENMSNIIITTLDPQHRHDAAGIVRDAFWDLYRPGCVEHLILDLAHTAPEYLPGLELAAELDGELVGVGLATTATVIGADGSQTGVSYLGPLAVAPAQQRSGIGGALLRELLRRSAALGLPGALLYGDPGYYQRFGFVDAAAWQITTPDGANFAAFQGVELQPALWPESVDGWWSPRSSKSPPNRPTCSTGASRRGRSTSPTRSSEGSGAASVAPDAGFGGFRLRQAQPPGMRAGP